MEQPHYAGQVQRLREYCRVWAPSSGGSRSCQCHCLSCFSWTSGADSQCWCDARTTLDGAMARDHSMAASALLGQAWELPVSSSIPRLQCKRSSLSVSPASRTGNSSGIHHSCPKQASTQLTAVALCGCCMSINFDRQQGHQYPRGPSHSEAAAALCTCQKKRFLTTPWFSSSPAVVQWPAPSFAAPHPQQPGDQGSSILGSGCRDCSTEMVRTPRTSWRCTCPKCQCESGQSEHDAKNYYSQISQRGGA